MKLKKFNENENKIPFDDDIKMELRKLYKNTIIDKANMIEERIDQLMNLHLKWLNIAKQHYSAEDIAKKLFKYDKDLGNIKENINVNVNEMHQNDYSQLVSMSFIIRKYKPDFNVYIQGNEGSIVYDGMTRFTTTGPATDNVILAYVSGMMMGLKHNK